MPLPATTSALVLNARLNGVTFLTQEGTGFNNTSIVTLEDLNPNAGDRYTFTCDPPVLDTPRRLLFKVTCTAVPANPSRQTKVRVTVTTGAAADDTGPVPVRLSARKVAGVHQNRLPRARLRLKANAKSVVFIPGTGFGEVNEVIPCELVSPPPRGAWEVVRARQLAGRVKVTLRCTAVVVVFAGGPTTDTISITLSPGDETSVEVPPIDVEYADDPDDDPE
jgi:hypothetical protein